MKQIDHDPKESEGLPGKGEREWARQKFGNDVGPKDLIYYLLPFLAVAVAMFLWRGY
jgi:hypothetical protein